MAENKSKVVPAPSREIVLTRLYDAPVKMVWDAWNEPEQASHWWGPRGFTTTTHSKDLRVGGIWHYTMHGPDGVDYVNKTKYLEVEKYSRMVYDHGGNDEQKPMFRVTVTFTDVKGKTRLDMTMTLDTPEAAAETRKFIKKVGGDSTWDRFAEYLAQESSGKDLFVINRTFDAPIEQMFELWTDPKHLAQWVPPTGFTMEYLRAEIKKGGTSFYRMDGSNNMKMYGKASYLEITKPNRIIYTQSFCDEHEKTTRHPMSPTWPETMLTTITLAEEGPERTRVTITWEVYGEASAAEHETFNKAKGGMSQGWTGSLDKLEGYLIETKGGGQ
ncbi:MAG TPA: SRPBCC family protein [bacterium]